jgi:hypothetical protein
VLERLGAELPGPQEDRLHPEDLGAADVLLEVVGHEPRELGLRVEGRECGREARRAGLADQRRLDAGRVLERGHEGASVEHRAARGLPPRVLVEAEEVGAGLDLGERAGEVHVAEDLVGLRSLVAPSDEDGVRALAHELHAVEVGDDPGHHERVDAPAAQPLGGGCGSRLELPVLELEPEAANLRREVGPGPRGVVGDEAQPVAVRPQPVHGLHRTRDRLARDVEDAVDVQQNGGHGR